jgi:hypothetical protein
MADGELTLTISGISSLVLAPHISSQRVSPNWLTLGQSTARGANTIAGSTARPELFVWRIDATVRYWQLLRFDRIRRTQQARLKNADSSGIVTVKDEVWFTDSIASAQSGRSVVSGSTLTAEGESASYCNFSCYLEVDADYHQLISKRLSNLYDQVDLKFGLREF